MAGSNTGGVGFSQTYYQPAAPVTPGAIVGSMPPQPWARSVLDARRMMYNREPSAEYPNGYRGTITDRREDRLFDSLKARQNQRGYQRGVHLGERIDAGDYLYPEDMDPLMGIARQMQLDEYGDSLRWAPRLEYFQPTPTVEGQLAPRGSESVLTVDQHRVAQLAMLKPKYGLPSRRQQSMVG